ncbi:AAA family ATPase [Candidatus Dependentiae bacterium]|nr:AAA family ATPase [Candidatus Dependentiae bacterium]
MAFTNFNADLYKNELKKLIKDDSKYKFWIENLEFEYSNYYLQIIGENSFFNSKLKNLFHSIFFIAAEKMSIPLKNIEYSIREKKINGNLKCTYNQKPVQLELFYTNKVINKLEPKFDFENFIVADTNKFAYISAINVTQNLGSLFNPFFLYGNTGCGKTHLVQSIAKYVKNIFPQINLKYFDAHSFKELYLSSMRKNNLIEFRERFRKADIFIMENIEELEGCYNVQEEFFNIYNDLIQNNFQLVITSKHRPDKLMEFMPRLINRFKTGLVVDIKNPDKSLKTEYIKNKFNECEMYFPEELISYFIEQCHTDDLKKIDVYSNKLIAYLSVTKKNISESVIDEIFARITTMPEIITINEIQKQVSQYFNINCDDLKSKTRVKDIILPKHIAMYLCRELTDFSLKKISTDFGKVDKATITHACGKIKDMITSDDKVCHIVKDLTRMLFNKAVKQ